MVEVLETACIAFFHDAISTHISAGCEPASSKVLNLLAATPEMESRSMTVAAVNSPLVNESAPENSYGISEWPDTDDIYERLAALIRQPIRPIRRENMETVLNYFQEKCTRSRRLSEQAARFIPGGVQHNLAFNYPFPLSITEASGAYLTDADGNRYIDFLKAGGPILLGSNDDICSAASALAA